MHSFLSIIRTFLFGICLFSPLGRERYCHMAFVGAIIRVRGCLMVRAENIVRYIEHCEKQYGFVFSQGLHRLHELRPGNCRGFCAILCASLCFLRPHKIKAGSFYTLPWHEQQNGTQVPSGWRPFLRKMLLRCQRIGASHCIWAEAGGFGECGRNGNGHGRGHAED